MRKYNDKSNKFMVKMTKNSLTKRFCSFFTVLLTKIHIKDQKNSDSEKI